MYFVIVLSHFLYYVSEIWGLDFDNIIGNKTVHKKILALFARRIKDIKQQTESEKHIRRDISRVRNIAVDELEKAKKSINEIEYVDSQLLGIFQKDLLPGLKAQVLETKQSRDSARPNVVSKQMRVVCWIFVVLISCRSISEVSGIIYRRTIRKLFCGNFTAIL